MYPDIPWAERELKLAAAMNPGPGRIIPGMWPWRRSGLRRAALK